MHPVYQILDTAEKNKGMKRMSRMATNEYVGTKRRLYATADREKRIKMLDEVCKTTGYERKYANRLLTGSRKFRERKGRGKTYGEDVDKKGQTLLYMFYCICCIHARTSLPLHRSL